MSHSSPGPGLPTYEEVPARAGLGGWLFVLLHFALGGVSVRLAFDPEWSDGGATFSSDAWRGVLAAVGALIVFLAARAAVRALRDDRPKLTPELHRRARARGRVMIVVGAAFLTMVLFDELGEQTISFFGWASPFYVAGGIYLMLLGLAFQADPTTSIRRMRLARGQGRRGVARILHVADTGNVVGGSPQVRVDLEIEVDGGMREASAHVVLDQVQPARLAPGATVEVLVDEVDPNAVSVDWETWKPPATRG